LLDRAVAQLEQAGASCSRIDLATLPADDLLGRTRSAVIERALGDVARAHVVLVSTPVYRATYSGLLKVFFDLFQPGALNGKVGIPFASGGSQSHQLVLEHGLRPLFASVGAVVVATGVYASDSQFHADGVDGAVTARIDRAVQEALQLARATDSALVAQL
jgi:FMN reductase